MTFGSKKDLKKKKNKANEWSLAFHEGFGGWAAGWQ